MKIVSAFAFVFILILTPIQESSAQQKKPMTLRDMMEFRQIKDVAISNNGKWLLHTAAPDRGDPEVMVYSTDRKLSYTIPLGDNAVFSNNASWVAMQKVVPAAELEPGARSRGEGAKSREPRAGATLLSTASGKISEFENIQYYAFSNDSRWLLLQASSEKKSDEKKSDDKEKTGTCLKLVSLEKADTISLDFVIKYALDSISKRLAYIVSDTNKLNNGLYIAELTVGAKPVKIAGDTSTWFDNLSWNNVSGELAFLAGMKDVKERRLNAGLYFWKEGEERPRSVLTDADLEENWKIYHTNNLRWSKDGQRLFLGLKPASEYIPFPDKEKDSIVDLMDQEKILAKRTVDVWHWNDPYINPNQKIQWKTEKDRVYTAVYYPRDQKYIQLADDEMPDLRIDETKNYLLGSSNKPYARQVTWEGRINDYYLVNLINGEKSLVLEAHKQTVNLSPDGKFLVYYKDGDWFLMHTDSHAVTKLTSRLDVTFSDEDWDYPEDVPGYGVAEWLNRSEAVLIYDKYDIWQFSTSGKEAECLTGGTGRSTSYLFRIVQLDSDKRYLEKGDQVLLSAYNDLKKNTAIYSMTAGKTGVKRIMDGPMKYSLRMKAKDANRLIFTGETYNDFPDLWVSDLTFKKPVKLTDVNPQVADFAWGKSELVEWLSVDGKPLQGVLVKPGNYDPSKKYPVLVYYYRFFTDQMYEFPAVAVNHRPCYPYYASNDYAIFLPDIRFDIGIPGPSATKCLVPGVQKIIDMGVADPEAVALHGHSWSGYQTAFVITQTDLFACAIAGAPVSNMTSAYSGIRWGTGLARQFQYEQSQSRIGGSLWEARDKYIENSPVFFADRINTPLLIEFGDIDDAVPWYQGIELYLAMRRLDKDCIFLQYRGEPHHLKIYANKLDYTIKFKEYLDHYLKGEEAAGWIKDGVLYKGE